MSYEANLVPYFFTAVISAGRAFTVGEGVVPADERWVGVMCVRVACCVSDEEVSVSRGYTDTKVRTEGGRIR